MTKKRCLTGIKASGTPHLGNYVGAIKPAIALSESHDSFYFIADYHALNSTQKSAELKSNWFEIAAGWLACGLDPEKTVFYRQSDIPEIFEIATILSCFTSKGLMNRAHSYKAVVQDNEENKRDPDWGVNMGLFNYPILMASDILSFKAELVPVGKDQVQHLEMTRDMAQALNSNYKKEILPLPEVKFDDAGLLPGIDGRKMSSSYGNFVPLFVPEKKLKKTINKITTDSTGPDEPKVAESSLVYQFAQFFGTSEEIKKLKSELEAGLSWGEAKAQVFEMVNKEIAPIREKFDNYQQNPQEVLDILQTGAKKARAVAQQTLQELKEVIGLG